MGRMRDGEDVLRPNSIVNKYNQELIEGLIRVIGATIPTVDLIGEKILADAIIELVQLRRTVRILRGELPEGYVDEVASKPLYPNSMVTTEGEELVRALAAVKHTSLPSRDVESEKILLDAIQELIELRKEQRALLGKPPYEPYFVFGRKMN
jgi:hypothetical protein